MTLPAVRVLVVGGSYAGLGATLNLLNLSLKGTTRFGKSPIPEVSAGSVESVPLDIHLVDERDGYVHLIGCPLAFASNEYAPKIWQKFEDIPALQHPSIRWTRGSVVHIDTEKLCAKIRNASSNEETSHEYDYLVAASGLRRVFPVVPQSTTRKQYLLEAANHVQQVQTTQDGVVVIGGGAVGIEMAAELKLVQPNQKVILIHSRDRLLSSEPLPTECSDLTIDALKEMGVDLILGQRVLETSEAKGADGKIVHKVTLQNGSRLTAGKVIYAISRSSPTSSYLPAWALNEEGEVKINNLCACLPPEAGHLLMVSRQRFLGGARNDERHYAIGDMVSWSAIKRCGGAIAQGTIAALNIYRQILHERHGKTPVFEELPRYPPVIALAVGHSAMVYAAELGASCTKENLPIYFRDDLGFQQTWDYMKMSEPW